TRGTVNEFFMGEKNPILITIPPGVWHGMKGIGTEPAMLVNTPTEPYKYDQPDEYRADPHTNDIPYDWSRKDG
ncbi:MAG TPA: dTDP-4-dehydrorhamnose 3,5-epimerase, partial [Candidatus Eisenbacteria bacterium]|nr:dTDP-4-dehydrorhamnose 3,5-epimerase [Candidatus Eisenbacteria bacterium]